MSLYVCSYVGSGSGEDPFRPNGTDAIDEWASIDLSPDGAKGRCIVRTSDPLVEGPGIRKLADVATQRLSQQVRNRLGNELGITVDDRPSLGAVLADLLLLHARTDGTRWRPLRPTHDRLEIHLGGLVWAQVAGGATITDNFNRANADALGAGVWTEINGDWDIETNVAYATLNSISNEARHDTSVGSEDMYAQCDVTNMPGDFGGSFFTHVGPCCRMDNTATRTFYTAYIHHHFSPNAFRLARVVAGTLTQLATANSAISIPDTVKVQAEGSTIKAFLNTVEVHSVTDTNIAGAGRTFAGIRSEHGSAHVVGERGRVDNFEAADLGGGAGDVTDSGTVTIVGSQSGLEAKAEAGIVTVVVAPSGAEAKSEAGSLTIAGQPSGAEGVGDSGTAAATLAGAGAEALAAAGLLTAGLLSAGLEALAADQAVTIVVVPNGEAEGEEPDLADAGTITLALASSASEALAESASIEVVTALAGAEALGDSGAQGGAVVLVGAEAFVVVGDQTVVVTTDGVTALDASGLVVIVVAPSGLDSGGQGLTYALEGQPGLSGVDGTSGSAGLEGAEVGRTGVE